MITIYFSLILISLSITNFGEGGLWEVKLAWLCSVIRLFKVEVHWNGVTLPDFCDRYLYLTLLSFSNAESYKVLAVLSEKVFCCLLQNPPRKAFCTSQQCIIGTG